MNMDDIKNCIISFEDTCKSLEEIENKLAKRLNIIDCNIREKLIDLNLNNELIEDELTEDWHQTYASYLDWLSYNKYVETRIYECLCCYDYETGGLSFTKRDNKYYQEILTFNHEAIIPLLKNIEFNWVVFSLLFEITKNCKLQVPEFPKESAGYLDKVTKYWIDFGIKNNYIHDS